jgi:dipeptidyl aminopeptidase/acylaminoacyl peptidase
LHLARIYLGALILGSLLCAAPAQATFPGENGKIVMRVLLSQPGEPYLIGTIDPDGENLEYLASSPAADIAPPRWSPDGSQILFSDGPSTAEDLYVMGPAGQNPTRVATTSLSETAPAWSPDGSRIAFTDGYASDPSWGNLWIMDRDGGNPVRLTNYQHPGSPTLYSRLGRQSGVDWSPDARSIAFNLFTHDDRLDPAQLNVIAPDGSGQVAFTNDVGDPPGGPSPSWSPDGSKIVFVSQNGVEVINADGTGRTVINPIQAFRAAWSPDGTKIAFTYYGAIYVMNADGTNPTLVLAQGGYPAYAAYASVDWQPLNRPPSCVSVTAAPALLWPANRRFRIVEIAGGSDPDGNAVTLSITGVTQDEPVRGARDALPTGEDNSVRLRAERDPAGDGRVYRIAFEATDGRGGACDGVAKVTVSRSRGLDAVDSAPPSYDSFGL